MLIPLSPSSLRFLVNFLYEVIQQHPLLPMLLHYPSSSFVPLVFDAASSGKTPKTIIQSFRRMLLHMQEHNGGHEMHKIFVNLFE